MTSKQTILTIGLWASVAMCALPGCKNSSGKPGSDEQKLGNTDTPPPDDAGVTDAGPFTLAPPPPLQSAPLGLPRTPFPAYNKSTPEKVALGALLFTEGGLSADGDRSCASCHKEKFAWSSGKAIDDTAQGKLNLRHTPSLVNMAYHKEYYWDGRSKSLEGHILGHWEGQLGSDPEAVLLILLDEPAYAAHFARSFKTPPDASRAAEALACYVRSLRSGGSPWDQYENGNSDAVSDEVVEGAKIFNERAGCATCHTPPLYTDLRYHSVGVPDRALAPDLGRSKSAAEGPRFKTPGLRSVTLSAPYFHNGSAATLEDVLKVKEANRSPALSAEERRKLLLFLAALTPAPKEATQTSDSVR